MLWFFANSSVIIAFVAIRQLCISTTRTNKPCGVRCVACHVQVALLSSFLGPPWCQWRSDWCALGCSATVASDCVCSSHVFWLRCSLQCLAFCRVGSGDTLWPVRTLVRRQVVSSRHSDAGGRRVMRARLEFWESGACGMGANQNKRAPLLAAAKGLHTGFTNLMTIAPACRPFQVILRGYD